MRTDSSDGVEGTTSDSLGQSEQQLSLLPESQNSTSDSSPAVRGSASRPHLSSMSEDEDNLPLITAEWPDSGADHELEANLGEIMKLGRLHEHAHLEAIEAREKKPGFQVHETGHFIPVPGGSSLDSPQIPTAMTPLLSTSSVTSPPVTTPASFSGQGLGTQLLGSQLSGIPPIEIEAESRLLSRHDSTPSKLPSGSQESGPAEVLPFPIRQTFAQTEIPPSETSIRLFDDFVDENPAGGLEDFPALDESRESKRSESISFLSSPMFSVGVLSSVPLALLAMFYIWGTNFSATPGFVTSLVRLTPGDLPRVPPPGFEVVGLEPKVEVYDSGKSLLELKGSIINRSAKSYRDITIEASIFDRENRLIERRVVSSSNGLSSVTSLTSLKPEVIEELQDKEGITHNVKSLEALPFRVIFPGVPAEAAYYSARVYSVRPTA